MPIRHLRHRLVVVPPSTHGDQRRVLHRVQVHGAPTRSVATVDGYGNHRVDVHAPMVDQAIEFEVWVAVSRDSPAEPHRVPAPALTDPRLRAPSPLTRPDHRLASGAPEMGRGATEPMAVAARINRWGHATRRYRFGATDVRTTAAEALALGEGVCQDYAHVMLAIARLCGLAARYVSGHLVGEGGSHAWTEVLAADPDHPGFARVVAFDPTHGRRTSLDYVTVAVGRDYADVAPTSGTFRAPCGGRLTARKRLQVTESGTATAR
jgi:transglutaminase-like putative cysteine protease